MILELLRWTLVLIILFLGGVGVWVIVEVNRMKREWLIAITMIEAMAMRLGMKHVIDKVQQTIAPPSDDDAA